MHLLDNPVQLDNPLAAQLPSGHPQLKARNAGGALVPIHLHRLFTFPEELVILARYSIRETEAEEILRQTQARFRSIVDSLSINLILKDPFGRRVYANRAYLKLRHYRLSDTVGKTDADIFTEEHAAQARRDELQIMETGAERTPSKRSAGHLGRKRSRG